MTRSPSTTSLARAVSAVLIASLASSCATAPRLPAPLRDPKPEVEAGEVLQESAATRSRPRIEGSVEQQPVADAPAGPEPIQVPPIAVTKPLSLVLDGVPLSSFINVVFGAELGFALEIDQAVRTRADIVSLRLTEPQSPQEVYRIAAEVLRNYGVRVVPSGQMLRFVPSAQPNAARGVVTTRDAAQVPGGNAYVAMPLDASDASSVAGRLRNLVGKDGVTITEMLDANAILISGPGHAVQSAVEVARTLDAAGLRTRRSIRINPQFIPADLLARELREVLNAEGYTVRTGPGSAGAITFVPVASANSLLIFSESDQALRVAGEWADRLDQPTDQGGAGGVYMYSARHTTVETMLPILAAMVGGSAPGRTETAPAARRGAAEREAPASPDAPAASGAAGVVSGPGGQIAVDTVRNIIVFQGEAQRWRAIQGVLSRLDQPARQVAIEVTVAEVTLTDEFSHGIEWALRNVNFEGLSGPISALGGSPNTGGLIWRALSGSGQVRAILNLFAKDGRVSILSTPRLMVKSGENASIDVGTEVPIITSQATAPDLDLGRPSILQQVQYRKTGVLLDINAVIHSGQRVDLKLMQEVSEATQTDTSDISSPSIFSRRLETSLTLADGQSMLLGGLISSSRSDAKTKVPLLGDIPLVGRAFQNRRKTGTRTELLMLITPYVIEDAEQARDITESARARFGDSQRLFPKHQVPIRPAAADDGPGADQPPAEAPAGPGDTGDAQTQPRPAAGEEPAA